MTSMKWGMVCSLKDKDSLESLNRFGEWLVDELEHHGNQFNLNHLFEPNASFCLHCEPGNRTKIYEVYETIHKKFADVIYVIHILPEKNSLEFKLLKDLTVNYALIGQGILHEKALNLFSDCDLDAVFRNMNQYISRRISQIICHRRIENSYRLLIGGAEPLLYQQQYDLDFENTISKCVEMVLHSNHDNLPNYIADDLSPRTNSPVLIEEDVGRFSSFTLIVEGFPAFFNKFQIASLFSIPPFFPLSVFISSSGKAFVDFPNKFQAAQAYILYKGNKKLTAEHADSGIFLSLKLADNLAQKTVDCLLSAKV